MPKNKGNAKRITSFNGEPVVRSLVIEYSFPQFVFSSGKEARLQVFSIGESGFYNSLLMKNSSR